MTVILPATDPTCTADIRRAARTLAVAFAFDVQDAERVAIVASELSSNVVKHGGGGVVVVQGYDDAEGRGVELIAIDRGPGIRDVGTSMQDGYSTAGTPGNGLGAIERLSSTLAIDTRPQGTVVLARVRPQHAAMASAGPVVGSIAQPLAGETVCGDDFAWCRDGERAAVLAVDGLGHGPGAATAAQRAVEAFRAANTVASAAAVEAVHAALKPTRGAAIAVAELDRYRQIVAFSGIGNISGAIVEATSIKRMVSDNGTAGHVARRIRSFDYPLTDRSLVVLNSDGIKSWSLDGYPGLSVAHPSVVAAVLLRDFHRGRDDASVIAMRWRTG